jgi:hypothetical protein
VAQQETVAHRFPDVTAALDWQVRRAIQLVRGKLGAPAAGDPAVRSARGRSQPTQRPRTMVDQVNALREKHL